MTAGVEPKAVGGQAVIGGLIRSLDAILEKRRSGFQKRLLAEMFGHAGSGVF